MMKSDSAKYVRSGRPRRGPFREPTVGHAHEATGELVRDRQRRGGERVEPQHDALLHVAEEQEGQVGAAAKRIRPIAIQERRSVAT